MAFLFFRGRIGLMKRKKGATATSKGVGAVQTFNRANGNRGDQRACFAAGFEGWGGVTSGEKEFPAEGFA